MRLTLLQKEILIWMILFLVCAGGGIYYINHIPNEHPGIIRLHVVANSDSPEDQALKLEVRDEILKFMDGQEDLASARAYIEENTGAIEDIAEEVIKSYGYEYPAHAKLKVTYIPEKSYEDLTLPAGNYEALKITLGRGDGRNWWCVIFPQLCLVGEEKDGDKIVLKSKIKEMMKNNQEEEASEKEAQKNGGESDGEASPYRGRALQFVLK